LVLTVYWQRDLDMPLQELLRSELMLPGQISHLLRNSEVSLPCLQKPGTGPYIEPDESGVLLTQFCLIFKYVSPLNLVILHLNGYYKVYMFQTNKQLGWWNFGCLSNSELFSPQSPSPIIRGWYNRPAVTAVPKVPPHKLKKSRSGRMSAIYLLTIFFNHSNLFIIFIIYF
jgi:hypothetical protein